MLKPASQVQFILMNFDTKSIYCEAGEKVQWLKLFASKPEDRGEENQVLKIILQPSHTHTKIHTLTDSHIYTRT